ncbi:putative cell wall-binding protein [Bacillus niacini]|uniref:Cell wall-binding protein n=1 Tax=Neobacillus niacini TaxID=86668 RepID=A0A852TDZ3_9BACI|nr:Ig-like domain-containing protein [Neobacillus niacini]NYE05907.1 putative cell wall-binding protein [Neobacillus niacini]
MGSKREKKVIPTVLTVSLLAGNLFGTIPVIAAGEAATPITNLATGEFKDAVALEINKAVTGALKENVSDYYKFTVTAKQQVRFSIPRVPNVGWTVSIYNGSESKITYFHTGHGSLATGVEEKTIVLEPGTYYVKVSEYSQAVDVPYQLTVSSPLFSKSQITVTDNKDSADVVNVAGLEKGDTINIYDAATGGLRLATATASDTGQVSLSLKEFGLVSGKVYVALKKSGWDESQRVEVEITGVQSNPLKADQVVIVNNTGVVDVITIKNLTENDVVKLYDTAGNLLGTSLPAVSGQATIEVAQLGQEAGKVYVTVTSLGYAESAKTELTYLGEKDVTPPAQPVVDEVNDKNTTLTGQAEAGAKVEVLVNGTVIGSTTAGADGKFTVTIPAQKAGIELEVKATDEAGNISTAAKVVVKDATAPEQPTVNPVTDKDTTVTGQAEVDSKVEAKANGANIGSVTAGADGKFIVTIPVQKAGVEVEVTATDKAGNISTVAKVAVKDVTAPEQPSVNPVTDKDTSVVGQAEADSKIEIKANGTVIGSATAGGNGKFTVTIPVQKADTELEVTATDKVGNVSEAAKVVVKDLTASGQPSVNPVTDKDTTVTGEAEAGSKVEVKADGTIIGSSTAGQDGKFTVTIPVQKAGTEVEVTATDKAGNVSAAAKVVVKDVTSPVKPTVNDVTDKDTMVSGQAEAGSKVEVNVNGAVIGSGTAGVDGKFTVTIPVQKAETKLVIIAADEAGNVSDGFIVTVKDVTAPGTPTVTELTDMETVVKGTSEPNATVIAKVSGVEIGQGVSDGSGNYSITIPAQLSGKVVEVYAVDKAGNVSIATQVTVQKKLVTLIGDTRYATAAKVSQTGWETAESVLLVNGFAIVDGLTATPLASAKNAPILLTTADSIPQVTLDELARLKTKEITLIGGEAVISPKVESMLKAKGYKVTRIGGVNRKDTSLLIAKELDKLVDVNTVYVAYAFGEPDALSISAQAGLKKQPIILVDKTTVPTETLAWLKDEQLTDAYFIGGEAVIASAIINQIDKITLANVLNNRISGTDRHETNAKVISKFYPEAHLNSILVAKSETLSLVDALTAGPLAAKLGSPVVLVSSSYGLLSSQKQVLAGKHSKYIHQIGGGVNLSGMK